MGSGTASLRERSTGEDMPNRHRAARECTTGRPRPNAMHGVQISRSRSLVRNERGGAARCLRGWGVILHTHTRTWKKETGNAGWRMCVRVGGHLGRTRRGEARG